jgi:hypothetical protein
VCLGVLSWLIEEGAVDGVDVSGLPAALAIRYSDDEPGSPLTWILWVGAAATVAQVEALDAVFAGRLGGDALAHFPWAWKESHHVGTVRAEIEVSHEPRRQWLRIRDRVSVEIRGVHAEKATVTCVIPGTGAPAKSWLPRNWPSRTGPCRSRTAACAGMPRRSTTAGDGGHRDPPSRRAPSAHATRPAAIVCSSGCACL